MSMSDITTFGWLIFAFYNLVKKEENWELRFYMSLVIVNIWVAS